MIQFPTIYDLLSSDDQELNSWLVENEYNISLPEEHLGLISFWKKNGKSIDIIRDFAKFRVSTNKRRPYYPYAASIIGITFIIATIFYYSSSNTNHFNDYYVKDDGLPVLMNEGSSYSDWMNSYKQGHYQEALTIIEKKTQTDTTLYYKGILFIQQNEWQKAIDQLKRVAITSTLYEKANYHLGYCYLALKDYTNAVQYFKLIPGESVFYAKAQKALKTLSKKEKEAKK